jgi:hypothetical protein
MLIFNLPSCIYSNISEYLVSLSIDNLLQWCGSKSYLDDRLMNLQSWRNFCNSSKNLSDVKKSFIFYDLNVRYSIGFVVVDDSDISLFSHFLSEKDTFLSEIRKLQDTVNNPTKQVLLHFDKPFARLLTNARQLDNFVFSHSDKFQSVSGVWWEGAHCVTEITSFKNLSFLDCEFDLTTSKNLENLSRIKHLRTVGLNNNCLSVFSQCLDVRMMKSYKISDVSCLLNVSKVILYRCSRVTDVSSLQNAKYIDLSYCENIVDVSMLGKVGTLILHCCSNVSNISALGLIFAIINVKYLDIVGLDIFHEYFLPPDNSVKTLVCNDQYSYLVSEFKYKETKDIVLCGNGLEIEDNDSNDSLDCVLPNSDCIFNGFRKFTFYQMLFAFGMTGWNSLEELSITLPTRINDISNLVNLRHLKIDGSFSTSIPENIDYTTLPNLAALTISSVYTKLYFYVMSPLQTVKLINCSFKKIILLTSLKSLIVEECSVEPVIHYNTYTVDYLRTGSWKKHTLYEQWK